MFFFFFISFASFSPPSLDRSPWNLTTWWETGGLDKLGPKIRGALPQKWGAKNMQNFGRFSTTSDFNREYLRNGSSCLKSENTIINYNPFHVGPNKFGELWSTNNRVKVVHIDQPKWTFFGRLHFGLHGVLHPEIFTHARDWPKQPSAHPNWDRGPPKKF